MRRTIMQISARDYVLAQDQDVDAVKEEALAAVRHDGDIVEVTLADHTELEILISTGIPITFHTVETPDSDPGADGTPLQVPDYDY